MEGEAGGGAGGGGGGGGGGGLYPPYTVPCSQSPGGSWSGGSVPPGAPHYMPGGGQPSPGPGQLPGQLPGQPPPPLQQQQQSQQSGGAGGGQAPLPSPLYPWMRSQFGNGNTSTLYYLNIVRYYDNTNQWLVRTQVSTLSIIRCES